MTNPHKLQRVALEQLHRHLGSDTRDGRAVVVMPCGTGKTLLGRWFAEQTAARLTVVFVPTLALVPQTIAAYRADTSWRHSTMVVCSDPTSGRAVTLDALAEHGLPDWAQQEVMSTTSQRLIAEHLGGPGPRLIVSTYHSAPKVAGALAAAGKVADLMVCDEAHRLSGRPRREFRAVLEQGVLPARRRLFLTATPVEAAAWAVENDSDDLEVGGDRPLALDDTDTFGPTVYSASFGDAVTAGRLVDYDVHVLAPTDDSADTGGQLEAVLAAARDGATRILTFHGRINRARRLAEALEGYVLADGRVIRAEHVESRHRAPRRTAALGRLADAGDGVVRVLCSARTLSEGVDVPAVDTVVFAEPRSSAVDVVQAVGRAMRTAPGKTRGRIVLAVAPGEDHDEDTALSSTAWRHVWTTLRALASMDERFAARLRTRLGGGNHGGATGGYRGGPVFGDGPDLVVPDVADLDRWVLRCLDKTGLSWWANYDSLADWARQRGHARPHPRHTHREVAVGTWVARQRTQRRAGQLAHDKVAALEELPGWAWDGCEAAWWSGHAAWTQHAGARDLEHLADVPGWPYGREQERPSRGYATLADYAVDTCARLRRGDLPGHLAAGLKQLDGWRDQLVDPDDGHMVDALAEYAAWQGHLNPPHDYRHDDDLPLGAWLTAVRRRRVTDRLDPALERELQALSAKPGLHLTWDAAETRWRLGYLALRQYAARENTCRAGWEHIEKLPDYELDLNRWCVVQRQRHRRGDLTPERVAALEQVPGWAWEVALREGYTPDLADHEHGVGGYERGCRCDRCIHAHGTEYERVPSAKARGHIKVLIGRGAAQKGIARAARINPKTIAEIVSGRTAQILPTTEAAILGVAIDTAQVKTRGRWGETVDARKTWRLIDAILALGWPKAWISREIGQDGRALQLHDERVSVVNAERVSEVHRRLRGREAPPRRSNRDPRGPEALPTLEQLDAQVGAA